MSGGVASTLFSEDYFDGEMHLALVVPFTDGEPSDLQDTYVEWKTKLIAPIAGLNVDSVSTYIPEMPEMPTMPTIPAMPSVAGMFEMPTVDMDFDVALPSVELPEVEWTFWVAEEASETSG